MESIKNRTAFKEEGFKKMNILGAKRTLWSTLVVELVIIAALVIAFVAGFTTYGIVFSILAGLFPLIYGVMFVMSYKKALKRGAPYYEKFFYNYEFKENEVEITYEYSDEELNKKLIESNQQKEAILYAFVKTVFETEDYFFIINNRSQGFMVEKANFHEHDLEVFKSFFLKAGKKIKKVQK